jgi:hypothetical protein
MRLTVRLGSTAAFLVTGLFGGSAMAQDATDANSLGDVQATHQWGSGVRLSEDLLLHPHVDLETGVQSNVFFSDPEDTSGTTTGAVGAGIMRIGLGASLSTDRTRGNDSEQGAPRLLLSGDFRTTWIQFLSGDDAVAEQSDLGISLILDAKINPQGKLVFTGRESFTRAVTPPPVYTTDDVDRDKNELQVGAIFRPGGGAIDIYGNYTFGIDLFERSDLQDIGNRQSHILAVGTRWQWLPKTQFSGEASFGAVLKGDGAAAEDTSSTPLRISVGTSTLLTPTFGTILRVGFGKGFYDGADYTSYLALAEGRLALGPTMRFAAGYSHDFADSLLGNFRTDHALYARWSSMFGGKFTIAAKGEVRFREYGGIPIMFMGAMYCGNAACTTSDRNDVLLRVNGNADLAVTPWLVVGLQYLMMSDSTDFEIRTPGANPDRGSYTWQEFTVRATATY